MTILVSGRKGGRLTIAIGATGLAACTHAVGRPARPAATGIPSALRAAAKAWNDADLGGHVALYAGSATMLSARGPISRRKAIAARLSRDFWHNEKPRQHLRFEQVVVRPLGDEHALVTGHFMLTGAALPERSGWLTLVWRRVNGSWRIIHDHST